jgi:hypothetical protein
MKFDFSRKTSELPRVPNYLGGRDRRAVTFWVLGLGFLLLIGSNFTNFSKFAKAILPGRGSAVDTRVPLEPYREPLPFEAVQLLPTDENLTVESALAKQTTDANNTEDSTPPKQNEPVPPSTVDMPPPAVVDLPKMPEHGKYYSGVNVPLLATIQNEAPFRQTETEVWYHLFDVLSKAAPEQLKKEATPIYDFATIFGQSNYYRGQAISLTGLAKWYMEIKSEPADHAAKLPKYYQIGFQINAREDNPMMVYVIDLPENMPRGKQDPNDPSRFLLKPAVPFTCVGIFFKNYAHAAGDGEFRLYPALLAKTIRLDPAKIADEPPTNPLVYLTALLCIGLLFFLVTYFLSVKRKKLEFKIPTPPGPEAFSGITVNELIPEAQEAWPGLPDENKHP